LEEVAALNTFPLSAGVPLHTHLLSKKGEKGKENKDSLCISSSRHSTDNDAHPYVVLALFLPRLKFFPFPLLTN
jgi:hypothetical protein